MLSDLLSPRSRILFDCSFVSRMVSLLVALAMLALGPLACASSPRPLALAATREALADLDEFGVLLVSAGLSVETIPQGWELSPVQAKRLRLHLGLLPSLPQC
jgi:hypothetical protein